MSITKSAKKVTTNAKNVVYAVVGAGDAAVKTAKGLPKRVLNVGSFASGIVRDASKRFDSYVVRGRKLVSRNGASKKPRTAKTKPAVVEATATPVVDARSSELPVDVPVDVLG